MKFHSLAAIWITAALSAVPVGARAQIAASVLPTSRSVQVGTTATAFATIINGGAQTATSCSISPATSVPANFAYRTTDPKTNAVTGVPNTPVNIPAGMLQTFVIAFTPTAGFGATDVLLTFSCSNTDPAPSLIGTNSILLSASSGTADIVALVATLSKDGILHLPSATGAASFAVATINLGATSQITATVDTGGVTLPLTLTICETNPSSGACLGPPASSVTTTIQTNSTPTFAIFASASDNVAPLFAENRIFVRFEDAGGVTRGSASAAVLTQGFNPSAGPPLGFTIGSDPPAGMTGQAYSFCFCSPAPAQPNGLCGSPMQGNPDGGHPPYHFQLDSGIGFPPFGISLSLNGCLTGTPSVPGSRTFGVCAVDLNGGQICQTTNMTVGGTAQGETWSGTLTGTLTPAQCSVPAGTFAENASLTISVPAPGLVALLQPNAMAPSFNLTSGTFIDSETVTMQTSPTFVSFCDLIGGSTGMVSLDPSQSTVFSSNSGPALQIASQSTLIPDRVTSQGGDGSVPVSVLQLTPTTITVTTITGNWITAGNGSESGNFASGTFTLNKQ